MLGNIKIGQYIPGDSWYYRLDPRTKIIATLLFVIVAFLANSTEGYIITAVYALVILLTSGISLKSFYRSVKPIFILILFTFTLNVFFNRQGDLMFEFYFIKIYSEGLYRSLIIVFRLILIVLMSSLMTFTTKPNDLTDGLESVMKPFKLIGIPTSELALMISIALRFIPTLLEEAERIIKAQTSRGADFTDGKLKDKIVQIISLLVPMFVIAFKRASELADTMEARGYIPGKKRTRLNELKYNLRDFILYFAMICFTASIIYSRYGVIYAT